MSKEAPAVTMPAEAVATMLGTIERLMIKIDQDREDGNSRDTLAQILEQHGVALKAALRPENQLHPDVSYYNPAGDRDHRKPALRRQAFLLGVPLLHEQLTVDEVQALNRFDQSLEVRDKRWQARILRDNSGGEVLFISTPFKSYDDLRGLPGLKGLLDHIHAHGRRPDSSDVIADRLDKAERLIAQLQASQVAPADAPPVAV